MHVIIANNDTEHLLAKIQEHIDNGCIIKSMYVVDKTEQQIIVLINDKKITKEMADIWWDGWTSAVSGS